MVCDARVVDLNVDSHRAEISSETFGITGDYDNFQRWATAATGRTSSVEVGADGYTWVSEATGGTVS